MKELLLRIFPLLLAILLLVGCRKDTRTPDLENIELEQSKQVQEVAKLQESVPEESEPSAETSPEDSMVEEEAESIALEEEAESIALEEEAESIALEEEAESIELEEEIESLVSEQETGKDSVVGSWVLGNLTGGDFNPDTGKYEGGASGLGQLYTFNTDGSYRVIVIWSDVMYFTGNYSIEDGVLTLTNRTVEESKDGGKTWSEPETIADASSPFVYGRDDMGEYLLIGEEGATLPLVDKTNALKYRLQE